MTFRTKTTAIFASIAILALAASPAFADNDSSDDREKDSRRANAVQWVKDRLPSPASKSQEFKAEAKNRLTEKRKNQLKEWWKRTNKRLTMLVSRLTKVADKISARLDAFAAEGKDVTAQRAQLVAARAKITLATQSVASASAQVETILANNTPADAFRKLHNLQSGVIAKIRDAHRALVTLLASLRNVAP